MNEINIKIKIHNCIIKFLSTKYNLKIILKNVKIEDLFI